MSKFKKLYDKGDKRLFENENLKFDICNEKHSIQSLKDYIDSISAIDLKKDENN